jgi:hydrogenase/urease accessory protein HupE
MKKIIVTSAGLLSISATSALAHPGPHDFSFLGSLYHLVTEPDHLAMMAGAALIAVALWSWRKSRA